MVVDDSIETLNSDKHDDVIEKLKSWIYYYVLADWQSDRMPLSEALFTTVLCAQMRGNVVMNYWGAAVD